MKSPQELFLENEISVTVLTIYTYKPRMSLTHSHFHTAGFLYSISVKS